MRTQPQAPVIGQSIAHYRVTAKLGAGGMGEVYRATDSKLGRDVALKVLPPAFAQDAQRMQRFQREAQVLASLNHPNIAAIYGIEHDGSTQALAMELVEGPTLAERIGAQAGKPVPLDDALPIAKQIAEALEYAHERGIIHRDLKPANIKLTQDGNVKVLDFGLAKALSEDTAAQDISNSPTLSMAATKAGLILGTAAYMSPEQARGKSVDRRADIWSFGVVLYEMLTGARAFAGEDVSVTLANVIKEDPDWRKLPASLPRHLRELLRRCLMKDPRKRLQAIGDARITLEESGAEEETAASPTQTRTPAWRGRAAIAVLLLAALAAGAALQSLWAPRSTPLRATRIVQPVPADMALNTRGLLTLALSPDGSRIVQVANNRLYVRTLDSLAAQPLAGTEGATAPFFSPDGRWVGFFAGGQTKKIALAGGAPIAVCGIAGFDATWGADDSILISTGFAGIFSVAASGGTPVRLVAPAPGILHMRAREVHGGKAFLYLRGKPGSVDEWDVVLRSFAQDDSTVVLRGANSVIHARTGHLLYARLSELFAVPFDLDARRTTGSPTRLAQNVNFVTAGLVTQFAVSDEGTLVYLVVEGLSSARARLVAVDRAGRATPLPLEAREYSDPKISPDGRFIAVHAQDNQNDVWVADAARGTMSRLSFDNAEDETPAWSPDGRTVAWTATRTNPARGIFRRAADGSGKEELVWSLESHAHLRDWTPDGRSLILEISDPQSRTDIWRLDLSEKPTATPFLKTPFNERNSRISPDGRWIAYVSDESGRDEIYVQSFPGAGSKMQVSNSGGDEPAWARHGKAIFYRSAGYFHEVPFAASPAPAVGKFRPLFPDQFESPQAVGGHTGYDVFPDGRFLVIQAAEGRRGAAAPRGELFFVFKRQEELRRVSAPSK